MKKRLPIALVVHGHFYQPPRENPWTDQVAREPNAAPFPNWNARINAECYRANAYARIYGPHQHILSIVNNYSRMSVDLGPTLARWLDRHDPHVMQRMRAGDEDQYKRLGAGGAMAQVWGHPITPLLSPHDLRTQLLWGLQDFRRHHGRDSDGLWLPETAVNEATLAALIEAGVHYTILAPEQIEAVRPADGDWQKVTTESLDTGRPYRFFHSDGSGRSIALAIFDGPLSRDLAFGTATRDAASFLEAMRRSAERSKVKGRCLVLAASDGELYGHHKKFADLSLAYAVHVAAPTEGIDVTNLGAFLAECPPTWEVRLRPGPDGEGTAWSCAHGLGRWQRNCGCRMVEAEGSSQAWRGPLREALNLLRDRASAFFEDAASDLFADPWEARNAYGLVADDAVEARKKYLRGLGRPSLRKDRGPASRRALLLMEMQRSLLLMYASCAWFFDDIAGPEPTIALRRAAHAMELWKTLGGRPPSKTFVEVLAKAHSNQPGQGNGADAFARACKDRVSRESVVARVAFSHLSGNDAIAGGTDVPGFDVNLDYPAARPPKPVLKGKASVTEQRTGETAVLPFTAVHDGKAGFSCVVAKHKLGLDDLDEEAARALRFGVLVRVATAAAEADACRTLVAVAKELGPCNANEHAALGGLFTRALALFLEQQRPYQTADWQLALELAERIGPAKATDDWRRVQEMVWEHMETALNLGKALPKPLASLAEQMELVNKAPAAETVAG